MIVIMCQNCEEEPIYGEGKLTKGLCLNCYNLLQDEEQKSYIEAQHDYEDGKLI